MMRTFLFVHGWGFSPDIWNKMKPFFEKRGECFFVNLGFKGEFFLPEISEKEEVVLVAHSFGFLWSLKKGLLKNKNIKKVIVINGFLKLMENDDFKEGVPRNMLLKMKADFNVDPKSTWNKFLNYAGMNEDEREFFPIEELNTKRMEIGLNELIEWDGREMIMSQDSLSISSEDDHIVPKEVSEKNFKNKNNIDFILLKKGGHLLLQNESQYLENIIDEWLSKTT